MRAPRIVLLLFLFLVVHCAPSSPPPTARPTRAPLAPNLAVQFALDTFHADSAYGRMVGAPNLVRGKIMALADAYALVNGKTLHEKSPLAPHQAKSVWLIVTRGEWMLRIPGAHGDPLNLTPTISAKQIRVHDLWNVILFDAVTGEVYEQGGVVETQRAELEKLPALTIPPRTP